MKITSHLTLWIFAFCTLCLSWQSYGQNIEIDGAYIRESIPGNNISSAYMHIHNNSQQTLTLLKITSDISPRIEIHNHEMHDGMMSMIQLDKLTVAVGQKVSLQPYGLHFMIFDLKRSLKKGEKVNLTLYFSKHSPITIQVPVKSIKNS